MTNHFTPDEEALLDLLGTAPTGTNEVGRWKAYLTRLRTPENRAVLTAGLGPQADLRTCDAQHLSVGDTVFLPGCAPLKIVHAEGLMGIKDPEFFFTTADGVPRRLPPTERVAWDR